MTIGAIQVSDDKLEGYGKYLSAPSRREDIVLDRITVEAVFCKQTCADQPPFSLSFTVGTVLATPWPILRLNL
jgi:hypothetical protein